MSLSTFEQIERDTAAADYHCSTVAPQKDGREEEGWRDDARY
jgi:hypothetical protein